MVDAHYRQQASQLQTEFHPDEVAVIAPHFMQSNDPPLGNDYVYWPSTDPNGVWRAGDESDPASSPSNQTISSFAVLDLLLKNVLDTSRFPSVEFVSLIGHSSGGQTVHRYAISTVFDFPERVQTVVANPSSFTYFDDRRWNGTAFSRPDAATVSDCSNFNAWQFGLDGKLMPPYVQKLQPSKMIERYKGLKVTYLSGQNDTCNDDVEPGCKSHGLEKTCMDMLEGWNRRNRSETYYQYLSVYYKQQVHHWQMVRNSGHDHTLMFQSPEGLATIFRPMSGPPSRRAAAIAVLICMCLVAFGVSVTIMGVRSDAAWIPKLPTKGAKIKYSRIDVGEIDNDEDDGDVIEYLKV